jgi:hypothetical protein
VRVEPPIWDWMLAVSRMEEMGLGTYEAGSEAHSCRGEIGLWGFMWLIEKADVVDVVDRSRSLKEGLLLQ